MSNQNKQLTPTHRIFYKSSHNYLQRSLKKKIDIYNSFTKISTASRTASQQKKRVNHLAESFQISPRRNLFKNTKKPKSLSHRKYQNQQSQHFLSSNKKQLQNKFQQSQRLNKNIHLKKESFLNHHYSIDFIKWHFAKNGGILNHEKRIITQQIQSQFQTFSKFCRQNSLNNAIQILINMLNYTIDLKLLKQFLTTLFYISHFYLILGDYKKSIFFFDQCRQCSKRLLNYEMMIQSYIGLSRCSSKINMHQQGIIFLKKGLEYAWYSGNIQKQLIIYDQIGIKYYRLGNLQKSKYFHQRFAQSSYEREDSAVKMMFRTRIRQQENKYFRKVPKQINIAFLVSLNVPIKSLNQLPNISKTESHRNQFTNQIQFSGLYDDSYYQLNKILADKQFEQQMPQPSYQYNEKYIDMIEDCKKNYPQIDFQLNRRLLKYVPKKSNTFDFNNRYNVPKNKSYFKQKLNLEDKITERLNEEQLDEKWYENLVQKIVRDRKSNLSTLRSKVFLRNIHVYQKMPLEFLNTVYTTYYIEMLF